ncbi:MAG: DUF5009 domain-containing protein [Bacteroidales bacterium]|nr:DUF5009 domain-containing protein [Bacteroidales bacterium]MBD5215999.1 DUF5009 domain-containing protein [Bacteroidales bacterium]MBD5219536.1 DUF5009 domain-containing protein [Bacteroidales bacterium]MDE6437668.1 DUF5009 domain-containing protein [Muribaculaceae bacterium]
MKKNTTATAPTKGGRLLALDILRGITIAGMILVNNPGSWGNIYAPLRHAEWNGLTPTDLVFPFFMFIMGISTYMSLRKYNFEFSWASFAKILRRSIVIFLIGWAMAWFGMFMRGMANHASISEAMFTFDRIRFLGVMPRLAICYGVGATIALLVKRNALPWLIGGLLVVYTIILIVGNGFAFAEDNVIGVVDRAVLGENHMYTENIDGVSLKFDPEGLVSTLPSIAHMLIGFMCGSLIMRTKDNRDRINSLFIVGTILTFSGFLLAYGCPINKKIWSPTFVLTTCGLASLLLGLLIWIIDIKGYKRWCRFFESFGINPLFMYCLGGVMGILFGTIRFPWEDGVISISGFLYRIVLTPLCSGDKVLASLLYALIFVMFNWCIGYILYKKKIYIKI